MAQLFLVEDHDVMRETLCNLLEREEDLVVCGTAATGQEALDRLNHLTPDLILIDISMPRMDGLELLEKIKERWPNLPCLILSGHTEKVYGELARVAGAADYLDKRQVTEIVPTVRRVLAENQHKSCLD